MLWRQRAEPRHGRHRLWNTVYLDRATRALARERSHLADPNLLQYLSPLGLGDINLTGDYLWRSGSKLSAQVVSNHFAG